jgi:hypothetical protein
MLSGQIASRFEDLGKRRLLSTGPNLKAPVLKLAIHRG